MRFTFGGVVLLNVWFACYCLHWLVWLALLRVIRYVVDSAFVGLVLLLAWFPLVSWIGIALAV